VPPSPRKKVVAAVATPIWRCSTPFCAATIGTWLTIPKPSPKTAIAIAIAIVVRDGCDGAEQREHGRRDRSGRQSGSARSGSGPPRRPVRVIERRASIVDTVMPAIVGASRSPERVGLATVLAWRKSGTNTVTPNSDAVVGRSAMLAVASRGRADRERSAALRSRTTNSVARTSAPATSPTICVSAPRASAIAARRWD
jgi:hypothetical protein